MYITKCDVTVYISTLLYMANTYESEANSMIGFMYGYGFLIGSAPLARVERVVYHYGNQGGFLSSTQTNLHHKGMLLEKQFTPGLSGFYDVVLLTAVVMH